MADPFPIVDEFGAGACTCRGTMTGCAVCTTASILIRYGKRIPRLANGTPDMITLGRRMGARHRAADSNNRHGLSLDGTCTGGTNWCAYCGYLELRANGLPVSYLQLSWAEILHQLKLEHPMIVPGYYGKVPIVSTSSYSASVPARGRSDSTFAGAHMVAFWQGSAFDLSGNIRTVIVGDPDFGSPARPVVPPHSVWSVDVAKAYWSAYGWGVTVVNAKPPVIGVVVPRWGSDVPANLKATDPNTTRTIRAMAKVHRGYGTVVNMVDLKHAFADYHLGFGSVINPSDMSALFTKARV